jgi:DNA-binding CsgD family transcriptional regulator
VDRLAASEFRRIHGFLRVALDADDDDAFPAPVLEALRRLIPCDVVSYGHFAARGRRWGIRTAPDGIVPVPSSVADAYLRLQAQDPFQPSRRTLGRAVRQSDLISMAELDRLDFYQEVARPLGIEHSMQLWLMNDDEIVGGFGFDASAADFSERDLAVLDFLAPDLLRLHRRAASRRRPAGETDAIAVLTKREVEVVRLVAAGFTNGEIGRTLFISPGTVRKHLDNVYARLGVRSRAAAVAVVVRPAST